MKNYLSPAALLFLGIWLVLLVGGRSRFFQDPGTFWHVAVGSRIIDDGFFDTDPYTFTFAGAEWIPHQWLGEGTMSVGYRLGGFDTLLLATATLLAAVYTGIGLRLMRAGLHPSIVAVVLALGVAASSGHFHVRPHIATIAGMAILFVYLTDVENGAISLKRLAWLIPVFWLWSNIHGGVLGGLCTFALAIGGWVLARLAGRPSPIVDRRSFLLVVAVWLAGVGVCFANPYTYRLPKSWLQIYQMQSLPSIIKEHSVLNLGEWSGLTVVTFGIVYILLLLSVPARQFRFVWFIPIVWFALACLRVRHGPLFAVSALIAIADLFPHSRVAAILVKRGSDLFMPRPVQDSESLGKTAAAFAVPGAVVAVSLLIQCAGIGAPIIGRGWAALDPTIWPTGLKTELQDHQFDRQRGTRIFCEYNFGGYLILEAPGYRVFIDDRCELFGDEFLVNYVVTKQMLADGVLKDRSEPFTVWQERYGSFDLALVATGGGFDETLDQLPDWERLKRNDTATLYRKRAGTK